MRFTIFSLFPEYFESPLKTSIIGRALSQDLLKIDFIGLRDFGEGNYRAVDDKPFGGGQGMLLKPSVFEKAFEQFLGGAEKLEQLEASVESYKTGSGQSPGPKVISLSPQGRKLTAKYARELAQATHLVLLCGHYEGIDERVVDAFVHEEVSVGDYVLTGGEPAALVLIDAISRFVPGVVGDPLSVELDTFEEKIGGLKYPMYTRPAVWRGREVPPVLVSGNHKEIEKWRKEQVRTRTDRRNKA